MLKTKLPTCIIVCVHVLYGVYMQGGPGGSSTGFGNFGEIGPYDVDLNPRNTTWVQVANVLFVDNPVGTGYSYVDHDSAYTTNVDQIAQDLLTLFSAFLQANTVFQVHVTYYIDILFVCICTAEAIYTLYM